MTTNQTLKQALRVCDLYFAKREYNNRDSNRASMQHFVSLTNTLDVANRALLRAYWCANHNNSSDVDSLREQIKSAIEQTNSEKIQYKPGKPTPQVGAWYVTCRHSYICVYEYTSISYNENGEVVGFCSSPVDSIGAINGENAKKAGKKAWLHNNEYGYLG